MDPCHLTVRYSIGRVIPRVTFSIKLYKWAPGQVACSLLPATAPSTLTVSSTMARLIHHIHLRIWWHSMMMVVIIFSFLFRCIFPLQRRMFCLSQLLVKTWRVTSRSHLLVPRQLVWLHSLPRPADPSSHQVSYKSPLSSEKMNRFFDEWRCFSV